MEFGSSSEINSVVGYIFSGGAVSAFGVFVSLAIVVWIRTKSTHMLMSRLWTLFNGKGKCKNIVVEGFLDTQSAVLQFRFLTGLQARTVAHISSLVSWAESNNEDIDDIAACGHYFDLNVPCLKAKEKLPGRWRLGGTGIVVILLLILALLSLSGFFLERAVLKMKDSGAWLTLDETYVKRLSDHPGFKLENCTGDRNKIAILSGFTSSDVDLICQAFSKDGVAEYVKTTVHSQRFAFGFLAVMLTYFFVNLYLFLMLGVSAREMHRRLTN